MELIKCRNCGREFMARANQEFCSLPECRKASHKAADHKYRKVKEKPEEYTVDNTCPKDCRFRDSLSGPVHYCNYGDVALREGLTDRPARSGSVKDCRVYEPGKKKRRAMHVSGTCPERKAENEVIAYKRECIERR